MLKLINRMRRNEDGQAMVIAAIGLLIMAIGVLSTAQIGFAVFERQKLQTLADAQAYSLATVHARAYNFFAFTNRAMVVHYVAMMHMQGLVSALTLMEAILGGTADFAYAAYGIGCCYPLEFMCGQEFTIKTLYEDVRIGVTNTLNTLDSTVSSLISTLFNTNRLLFAAQTTFAISVLLNNVLSPLFNQLLNKTDKDIDVGVSTAVSDAANTYISASILDMDAMKLPNTSAVPGSAQGNAEVAATEIANSTRVPENMLTNRTLAAIANISINLFSAVQNGQSRMLQYTNPEDFKAKLPTGNVMTSKDSASVLNSLFPSDQLPSSLGAEVLVQNDFSRGKHKRYWRSGTTVSIPPVACDTTRNHQPLTQDDLTDNNHGGWQGIGPFMTLRESNMNAARDFGQHGVAAWLNKKTEKLTREGLGLKFTMHAPTYQKGLDTSIGRNSALTSQMFRGINSIATAQVYYHRPGNWREVPNLFNPFWKARLYPVAQWLDKWVVNGVAGGTMPAELMQLMQYVVIH